MDNEMEVRWKVISFLERIQKFATFAKWFSTPHEIKWNHNNIVWWKERSNFDGVLFSFGIFHSSPSQRTFKLFVEHEHLSFDERDRCIWIVCILFALFFFFFLYFKFHLFLCNFLIKEIHFKPNTNWIMLKNETIIFCQVHPMCCLAFLLCHRLQLLNYLCQECVPCVTVDMQILAEREREREGGGWGVGMEMEMLSQSSTMCFT